MESFDYRGVTLDGGEPRRQFDEVRDYYLRIPNDDLLKGFRLRAGLPAPGVDLGGWYTADVGHIFGQLLSGFARMYAATGDIRCRDKANALLHEWSRCIEPDGYFFYTRKLTFYHYTYDKMVGGLVDMYLYCGNKEALGYLSRITDWAIKNLDRTKAYMDVKSEWYTLSENLYRAYLATGDTKYRDFAQVWEYTDYWDIYAKKAGIFDKQPFINKEGLWYHAYSHVNALSSDAASYLVRGDRHYLDTLVNAYDYLQSNQVFATGGYGPEERLLPRPQLIRALSVWPNSCETQCCSWAGFKMSKYLIAFTGDAKYGDWIERLMINTIGASMPMSPDGRVLYHVSYNVYGYAKHNIGFGWSCCTGTRPMAVSDYHDLIYFKDADDLYVNLYAPSTVKWNHRGERVVICQKTHFPAGSSTELTVGLDRPSQFGIKVRVPGWANGPLTASLNGKPVVVRTDRAHWAVFQRKWRDGDRLSINLPMKLWLSRMDSERGFPAAIMYGPVVLAARSAQGNPGAKIDFMHIDRALVPSPGETLTYHLASDPSVLIRPLYSFKEDEPYFAYMDPDAANRALAGGNVVLAVGPAMTWSAGWENAGLCYSSSTAEASVEYPFEGTGVRWLGCKFDDAGKASIEIDGKEVAVVDQYGPGRDIHFQWEQRGLALGKHSLKLTILGEKSDKSKGCGVNVAAFEVIGHVGQ
ncbi:MAG: beta-L-arabinofuranosidase domain-containing protein [Armatimonadota bacterium]